MNATKNWLKWSFAVSLIGLLTAQMACQPDPGEALNERKRRENEEEILAYLDKTNLRGRAEKNELTGLYIIRTKTVQNGQLAVEGDEVKYYFVQSRLDSVVVDSSETAAGIPNTSTIGAVNRGTITARLYQSLQLLKEGEEAIVLAPYDPTDVKSGNLLLPAYTPVRYDVRVVSVRTEEEQIQDYLVANKLTAAEKTESGLRFLLTKKSPADSAQVKAGQTAKVKYTGKLLNGTQFDASANGTEFSVGTGAVIQAWDEALVKMRVGEKATIVLPSSIGYGPTGRQSQTAGAVSIPSYAPLAFELEVVSAK
ncbi:FKBP-type peptidyl-prolyl cis-trans isomerase [Larkinella insperata]|uniref:Peptidyl-prolyl cis-trans isomerase n=1 Tax=Larkinella insperata TaxID=332158 RepID=A0ABW3QLT1_9BACT|nr:FKBP-type peptidyl-prolyl cis-trans isomerase [Larkinella insperata]